MQSKLGSIILHLACLILGALFLLSIVTKFSHPPAKISGWLSVGAKAFGLYNIYDVIRFKNKVSASSLAFIALILGALAIFQGVFIAASLGPVMQANAETMAPLNTIIWTTIAFVLIDGFVYCLCGAAFWLPAVKRLLIDYESEEYDEFDSEIDEYGVSLGPAITMSGPEFLKWLEENADDQPSDGTWLYIKFPEPLLPEQRHRKYDDQIGSFLAAKNLGYINGGGTSMTADKTQITSVGVEVVVYDRQTGVDAVVQILRELEAPSGTQIYVEDDIINVW